jgi:beta-glucosidase
MLPRRGWFPPDILMARLRHLGFNLGFPSAVSTGVMRTPLGSVDMPEVRGTQDYFGLNYYTTETAWFDLSAARELFTRGGYPEGADLSSTGFLANIPQGLYDAIHWAVRLYPGTPILITENGVESSDDAIRPRYIAQHLHQVWRALNFNWPVKGYFHWSLVDNFEWDRGWTQRFGLWALNTETQERTRRPSADLYAAICRSNSLASHMVRQYCPEVFDKIFPPFGD